MKPHAKSGALMPNNEHFEEGFQNNPRDSNGKQNDQSIKTAEFTLYQVQ